MTSTLTGTGTGTATSAVTRPAVSPVTSTATGTIAPAQLIDRLRSPAPPTVIDVRSAGEFGSVHIGGSYNVPLELLDEHSEEFARRFSGEVVLICRSGSRAQKAQGCLDAVGESAGSVLVLDGGIAAFESAGGDVVHGSGTWAMDRQVRLAAGALVVLGFAASRLIHPAVGLLSAGVGAGLVASAVTDSCAMARGLAMMPWNTRTPSPSLESAIRSIPRAPGVLD